VFLDGARLELRVNGRVIGAAAPNDVHVFVWPGVTLAPGVNTIEVTGQSGGKIVTDSVTWTLKSLAAAPHGPQ
jgi:beta-galactosidase